MGIKIQYWIKIWNSQEQTHLAYKRGNENTAQGPGRLVEKHT